ncbi:hypothetical protein DFH11DRAFT_124248 [Phellopilus nigrolimitatus]|nr:hypothetical protein DFH11DRAFT_124248 [Phellopilus nigrolimitatus]
MYVYDDHPFQPPIPSSPSSASTGAAYLGLSYPSFNPVYDAPFYAQESVPTSSSSSSLAAALDFPQPDKSQPEPVDRTRPIPALPRGGPPENLNLETGANFDPNSGRTVERTRDITPNMPREHVNPNSRQDPQFPDSQYQSQSLHSQSHLQPLPHQPQPHPQSQPQPQVPLPPHTHHFPPDATNVFQPFDSWPPSADAFTADSSLHGFHGSFSGGGAPDFSGEPFAFFPNDPAAYYSEPLPAHLFANDAPGGWGEDAGMGFGEACFDFSGAATWEPPPAAFGGKAPMPVLHEQSTQVVSMAPPPAPALGHAGGGNGSNAQFASVSAARPDAGLARDRSQSLSVSAGAPAVVGAFGGDHFHASAHQHQHQQLQELQRQHQQQHVPGSPSAEELGLAYSPHSQANPNHVYTADHGMPSTGVDGDRDLRRPESLGADKHREVCIITSFFILFYFYH